jgi:predicted nucleic acid-binding protein
MTYLVDTNILLRFLNRADPDYTPTRAAVRILKARGDEVVTAAQNLAEFWNVLTRPTTARGGYGLSAGEAERRLNLIEHHFPLLPDSAAAYVEWKRLVVAYGVVGVQVHDARLVALMKVHGTSHVLTLNKSDFAGYSGITAVNPEDILRSQQP